jgi:hypothetical protein
MDKYKYVSQIVYIKRFKIAVKEMT